MSEVKRRTPEEQLAKLDEKMEQLKAKRQQIRSQISQKERKERTRRLIQIGAIFERQFPEFAELPLDEVSEIAVRIRGLYDDEKGGQQL